MELSAFLTQLAESGVAVVTGDEALEPGDGAIYHEALTRKLALTKHSL